MDLDAPLFQPEHRPGQSVCQNVLWWSLRMNGALLHDYDPVGTGHGPVEVMQDQHDPASLPGMRAGKIKDQMLTGRILRRNWLVKQQKSRCIPLVRHRGLKLH